MKATCFPVEPGCVNLANYTVSLFIPTGLPETTIDKLCDLLDTNDFKTQLTTIVQSLIHQNGTLRTYVSAKVED